jgi:hypothetical protein
MNLGTAATIVGQRLGVNTSSASTNDGAAVRSFLTTWHNTLWRSYLWKDSILEFVMPFTSEFPYSPLNNYMPSKNRIIYPPIMGQILGLRFKCRALNVQRPMFYYRANYGAFFQSGYVADFELLSAAVWEFDTAQTLYVVDSNATDANQDVTLDELQADGATIVRSSIPLSVNGTTAGTTDRVDTFLKPQTQSSASLSYQTGTATGTNLVPAGATYTFAGYNMLPYLVAGQTYTITWGANDELFTYGNTGTGFTILNPAQTGPTATFTLPAGSDTAKLAGPPNEAVTAQITQTLPTLSPVITISASQTEAPKSQRVQLIGSLSSQQQSETLYTLGKRVVPTYVSDSDIPGVSGFTEILIPLAYYNFRQRDEQGGGSDALSALAEAVGPKYLSDGIPGGLLRALIRQETEQAAYNCRVIPSHGFGGLDYRYPISDKSDPYCGWDL